MKKEIHRRLREIEGAYYDGARFEALSEKIVETAILIAALEDHDADRRVFEVYAPLLWGEASGAAIDPEAIKTALGGAEGASHLRSWSGMGRVLMAYQVAA